MSAKQSELVFNHLISVIKGFEERLDTHKIVFLSSGEIERIRLKCASTSKLYKRIDYLFRILKIDNPLEYCRNFLKDDKFTFNQEEKTPNLEKIKDPYIRKRCKTFNRLKSMLSLIRTKASKNLISRIRRERLDSFAGIPLIASFLKIKLDLTKIGINPKEHPDVHKSCNNFDQGFMTQINEIKRKIKEEKNKNKPETKVVQKETILKNDVYTCNKKIIINEIFLTPLDKVDVTSKEFLDTYDWKSLRVRALQKYGRRCMCCGASPDFNNRVVLNVDHIKPRKHYPELALSLNNLQILCSDCNHGKGNWNETDFRAEFLKT